MFFITIIIHVTGNKVVLAAFPVLPRDIVTNKVNKLVATAGHLEAVVDEEIAKRMVKMLPVVLD